MSPPFDAGSAVEALWGPPVLRRPSPGYDPYHDPEHVEVTPEGKVKPGPGLTPGAAPLGGGMVGPGPALDELGVTKGLSDSYRGLGGIWDDFKIGLPIAGIYLFLAVLFLVGLVMVFSGASAVEVAQAPVKFINGRRQKSPA
jgi:hypothetical protein